jgi:replicative DNA helicase
MAAGPRLDSAHAAGKITSEILDRMPPHNLDAERGVLGSLLLDPNLCDDVILLIKPEDFYADANRKLFAHMVTMHSEGKRIDALLLVDRLKREGDLEAVGGAEYLADIARSVPVAAHAVYYAGLVREKATLRSLIHTSTEIIRDAFDESQDPLEMVSRAEQKIFSIHDHRSQDKLVTIQQALIEAFNRIDAKKCGSENAILTGFTDLDAMTGGMHDAEFIVVAARPSMGKTALAMNIAEYATIEGKMPTLFVSLEMSRYELAQRLLCSVGKIRGEKLRKGMLSAQEHDKLVEVSNKLSTAPLMIDDTPSRSVSEVAAVARRLKRRIDLRLIIVDYLQLIEPDYAKDPRQEQVAKIARRLKSLARELNVPLICVAQLNRQAEASKESHRPKLSQLRESGAIEQDADVVLLIHREDYYQSHEEAEKAQTRGMADLIVAKQRNGPTGDVKLTWRQEFTRFENCAQRAHEEFQSYGEF